MAYRVVWTQTAQADLKWLVRYIANDNAIAAKRFGYAIVDKVEGAALFPKSGKIVHEKENANIREFILSPYRLVYEISNDDEIIYVLRLWHSARGKIEF